MMRIDIRRAAPDDHPRMLDIWERSVRATHDFLVEHDVETLRPLVAAELASSSIEWWVAVLETDLPIAILGWTPGVIEGLFVDPDYRGRGAGSRLVSHAQSLTGEPLRVDVNEANGQARGFYESLGFEVVSRSATDDAGRPFPVLHMRRRAALS